MLFVRDIKLIRTVSPVDALEVLPINQTAGVKGRTLNIPVVFTGKRKHRQKS